MNTPAKTALRPSAKPESYLSTGTTGLNLSRNSRRSVLTLAGALMAILLIAVITGVIMSRRSDAAATAFGDAMQVYQAPTTADKVPPAPGVKVYSSVQERAQAANKLFTAIADKYGMTADGKNARYFAGLTAMEEGQTQTAETTLKKVADSWDANRAALGKLALADLYRQSGRDSQAIALYNQLAAKPASTVPAATAQIALAELYTAQGRTEQARKIYAQIVDKDKSAKGTPGVASTLASQKLNPQAAAGPAGLAGPQ